MVRLTHKKLKIGWYSGRDELTKDINLDWFDYIKIGHYDEDLGPLNKETTNQRLYLVQHNKIPLDNYELEDITSKFWK